MVTAVWGPGLAVSDNDRLIHGKQGRMIANRAYMAFKVAMAWEIKIDVVSRADIPMGGQVAVTLLVDLPPRMDTSAIIKAAGDAVQISGVIADDNQIDRWTVERLGRSPRGQSRIEFQIEETG